MWCNVQKLQQFREFSKNRLIGLHPWPLTWWPCTGLWSVILVTEFGGHWSWHLICRTTYRFSKNAPCVTIDCYLWTPFMKLGSRILVTESRGQCHGMFFLSVLYHDLKWCKITFDLHCICWVKINGKNRSKINGFWVSGLLVQCYKMKN